MVMEANNKNPDQTAPLGYLSREDKQMRGADNKSHDWQETSYRSKKACWVQALTCICFSILKKIWYWADFFGQDNHYT